MVKQEIWKEMNFMNLNISILIRRELEEKERINASRK